MYHKNVLSRKTCKKIFVFGVLKVSDENSRTRLGAVEVRTGWD
jgi:hypothetical protein